MFKVILAFDADQAGDNAVFRTLEREIENIEIVLTPAEMLPNAYRLWLRGLGVSALMAELDRLKTDGDPENNPDDIVKARLLNDQFVFCRRALNHAKHRNKYLRLLGETRGDLRAEIIMEKP